MGEALIERTRAGPGGTWQSSGASQGPGPMGRGWEWGKAESKARQVGLGLGVGRGRGLARGARGRLGYLPISEVLWGRARRGEVELAHPCPAPNEEVQHVLANLVMVLVQELVHLRRGRGGQLGWTPPDAGPGTVCIGLPTPLRPFLPAPQTAVFLSVLEGTGPFPLLWPLPPVPTTLPLQGRGTGHLHMTSLDPGPILQMGR